MITLIFSFRFAGLNSHYGANFLNLYLYKFLPTHGQVLVLHVINHEVKMTADEIVRLQIDFIFLSLKFFLGCSSNFNGDFGR